MFSARARGDELCGPCAHADSAALTLEQMRDQYPDRATNLDTSIHLLNSIKAGPLGQAVQVAAEAQKRADIAAIYMSNADLHEAAIGLGPMRQAALLAEQKLFRRFCLRGWLSMLVVQIRGEA